MRLALATLLVACADPPPPVCSPGITGVEAYDAIYAHEALHATDARARAAPDLLAIVERAERADPASLPPAARIALQNDLWGLWQRLRADGDRPELARVLARLIRRLALPADRIGGHVAISPHARRALDEQFREVGMEMPVLGHERAFELRRVFHVLLAGDHSRALTSQLVALDDRGRAHPSEVPGDLEILAMGGGAPIGARLFELDRRALRCGGPALVEVDRVSHVPGIGASSFFLELEPPVPIAEMPCARCHEDDHLMSLADARFAPEPRIQRLIDQATELAAPIFEDE